MRAFERPVGPWGARPVGGPARNDTVLAGDDDALFTVLDNTTPVQTLRRLDPATGAVRATRRGTHVVGRAVIVAGKLWVVSVERNGVRLLGIDLRTLATRASITVVGAARMRDATVAGAVTRTGRIYLVYNSDHIAVIDAVRGQVARHYVVPGGDVSAGVDPAGARMYVVTTATHGSIQTQVLTVRDPDTGALVRTVDYHPHISPGLMGVVAASRGGVWIGEGSGMTYGAAFHPANHLDRITRAHGAGSGGFPLTVTNAATVVWFGSRTKLLCADPSSGKIRAGVNPAARGNRSIVDIAQAGSRTFADYEAGGDDRLLVTITPPRACYA